MVCLTTDQLFCLPEKWSCRSPKRILYMSQIHVMVISEINCCFESGIHDYSPYGHIHVQILHKIVWWSSVDLPDHVVDGFRIRDCLWRYGKEVFQRWILLFLLQVVSHKLLSFEQQACTDSESSVSSEICTFSCVRFPCCSSFNPSRYASFTLTWDAEAASN